jgi:AcrR family transcriptional regulator
MATPTSPTRERILEAAESVFADKGYHDAAVDEIGRATSMSKGGLYFHFPSKEELFFAVLDRLADRLVAKAQAAASGAPSPLAGAEAALESVLAALSRRRHMARLLMVQGYSMGNAFERKRAEIFSRFAAVIRENLDAAVIADELPPTDTAIAARVWLGALNEAVVHWLHNGGPSPVQQYETLRRLLLYGTAPTRPGRVEAVSGAKSLSTPGPKQSPVL